MMPNAMRDDLRANHAVSHARETTCPDCACDERAAIHALFAECRTKAHALAPLPMLRLAEALAALAMLALPMMP